jgi:voltage-gated potassium channel
VSEETTPKENTLKRYIHEVIFGTYTPAGKNFDIALIVCIVLSVAVVMLDSIRWINQEYHTTLTVLEWTFTILFTIEYLLRVYSIGKPMRYILSFYGIVDLLAVIPTYLSLFIVGSHYLAVIRILRLLRIFRVLKIVQYLNELEVLMRALQSSRRKIFVFMFSVLLIAVIAGSLMYVVEGDTNESYTSIPKGVYWAVVTMTTVGYGDISPDTPLGQLLATFLMIMGYGIIAVPTGIITVEMTKSQLKSPVVKSCPECSAEAYDPLAVYCNRCGAEL